MGCSASRACAAPDSPGATATELAIQKGDAFRRQKSARQAALQSRKDALRARALMCAGSVVEQEVLRLLNTGRMREGQIIVWNTIVVCDTALRREQSLRDCYCSEDAIHPYVTFANLLSFQDGAVHERDCDAWTAVEAHLRAIQGGAFVWRVFRCVIQEASSLRRRSFSTGAKAYALGVGVFARSSATSSSSLSLRRFETVGASETTAAAQERRQAFLVSKDSKDCPSMPCDIDCLHTDELTGDIT